VRVTVFGASGVIGQALLPQLAAEHEVVAVSRGRRAAEGGIQWTEADVASGTGVAAALERTEVAYYLVHSLGARDFERHDREAARNVSREAKRAGVEQIVYLGGLGGEDDAASAHLRSRREMVEGKGSAAFETILALVRRLPVMITPSWVSTPTQPIALEDVARYLAGVAGNEAAAGAVFDAGGPEVMTYRQMIERVAALLGKRPRIVEVPVLTPALSALWLELVTPVNASVARPLIEGLRTPTVAREERLRTLLPFQLTSFDEAARRALEG
jgi:uncharacterized protein YbjT (DUF2867 family)